MIEITNTKTGEFKQHQNLEGVAAFLGTQEDPENWTGFEPYLAPGEKLDLPGIVIRITYQELVDAGILPPKVEAPEQAGSAAEAVDPKVDAPAAPKAAAKTGKGKGKGK